MKLPAILGIRGARDKPKDSYGGQAYADERRCQQHIVLSTQTKTTAESHLQVTILPPFI